MLRAWKQASTLASKMSANKSSLFSMKQTRSFYTNDVLTTRDKKLFDKILIANRGEIARRIIRTCKRLGIKTVAVHSTVDKRAPYVQEADEAVHLPGTLSSETYLVMENIINACKQTGAQAVHPGYGFLSENPKFVAALEKEGITFIGPPSTAISAMGDKIESKKLAQKAGVNIIPGRLADIPNAEEAVKIANEIGYPVMIKAAQGGGGKGMRMAWNDKEAAEAYRLSKDEAKSAFASDRILVEKFIDNPRHVEVQVMADGNGTALYLNERECSIQRRNQKVLEEAPSPFVDPETRKKMGLQAVSLATAVGYKTAGTVEMLMDSQKNFYFLEMNTRLQVEHPITEMITGFDLVELMIRIAAGEKLIIKQNQVPINGWAMEARLYAEDPYRNFLPSIGYLEKYQEPAHSHIDPSVGDVRVESALVEGNEISMFYDPMIAKVVTHGANRKESIEKLNKVLDSYVVRLGSGNNNISFLRAILDHPRYLAGKLTTKFIPEEWPEGFKGYQLTDSHRKDLFAVAGVIDLIRKQRDGTSEDVVASFEQPTSSSLVISTDGLDVPVTVKEVDEHVYSVSVTLNGTTSQVEVQSDWQPETPIIDVNINGKNVVLQYIRPISEGFKLQHVGTLFDMKVRTPRQFELSKLMPKIVKPAEDKFLLSPMPGRVVSIAAQPGMRVLVGEELMVVEAMKMRNILRAQHDGIVKSVKVQLNQSVSVDEILVEFEDKKAEETPKK